MRQDGLAALLRAAQLMPPLNPEDADLTASPFGPLLAEARAWCKAQEEADHG
jgi:hypothetical protein